MKKQIKNKIEFFKLVSIADELLIYKNGGIFINSNELSYAVNNGIINLAYVREQIKMKKREEMLRKYGSCIWYDEKRLCWYCHIPDSTKKERRKLVKRKKKEDIEDVVFKAYEKQEENTTFENLFYEFIKHKQCQVSTGTIKRIMTDWVKFYKPYHWFIGLNFRDITKIDVDKFLNTIVSDFHLKDKAFKNMCGIIKQTFEYAVDAEYIDKSPYRVKVNKKKIEITRKKNGETEIFTFEERKLIENEMERRLLERPDNTAPLGILLLFETGLRVGELVAISEGDITSDGNKMLYVHKQQVRIYNDDLKSMSIKENQVVEYTKSDAGTRKVPLTNKALYYINRIKNINRTYGHKKDDFLFVNGNTLITEDAINAQLRRSCRRIGMKEKSTHKIRKTYASTLYRQGIPIPVISKLLGHADESTTLKHYIFDLNNQNDTYQNVLDALCNYSNIESNNKVTIGNQKIINFSKRKKMGNPNKFKVSQA